jgi:hypothetical protein
MKSNDPKTAESKVCALHQMLTASPDIPSDVVAVYPVACSYFYSNYDRPLRRFASRVTHSPAPRGNLNPFRNFQSRCNAIYDRSPSQGLQYSRLSSARINAGSAPVRTRTFLHQNPYARIMNVCGKISYPEFDPAYTFREAYHA